MPLRHSAILAFVSLAAILHAGTRYRPEEGGRPLQNRLSASAGGDQAHTCAVKEDGTVWCWGSDFSGELGDGLTGTVNIQPVQVKGLSGVTSVASGASHTCALLGGGGGAGVVQCWGSDGYGQLGPGGPVFSNRTSPITVTGLDSVMAIAAGSNHTCALKIDGTVWCWGDDSNFQLGNINTPNYPVRVQSLPPTVAIAAGGDHTCAVAAGGTAYCWGENDHYQVGALGGTRTIYPLPVYGLDTSVVSLALGLKHSCAVLVNSTVFCWGANSSGQLGDTTFRDRAIPVEPYTGGGEVAAISAGAAHTCIIKANGSVACWGLGTNGQLGGGLTTSQPFPEDSGVLNAVEITGGPMHTCASDVNGAVRCWGTNIFGELGTGGPAGPINSTPLRVQGISGSIGARGVAVGDSFNCARRGSGGVSCWGKGASGELGNGAFSSSSSAVNVTGVGTDVIGLAAGSAHACAVHANGTVSCWGLNTSGQVGDGTLVPNRNSPVAVQQVFDIVQIAAGTNHTCALWVYGFVSCWGSNLRGQLGNPVSDHSAVPVAVTSPNGSGLLEGVISISAGGQHTCAVTYDELTWCWGDNTYKQLGDGGAESFSVKPVTAALGMLGVTSSSGGAQHSCTAGSMAPYGTVYCWGNNSSGEIGDGSLSQMPTPIPVDFYVVAVSAGVLHSCDVYVYGTASCWGDNSFWQLATADTSDQVYPAPVISTFVTVQNVQIPIRLSSVTSIGAGQFHTCALLAFGGIVCWGSNFDGQLGNGTNVSSRRPVTVNSFTANVNPSLVLQSNGRIALVTALVNCPVGGEAHLSLTLVQGAVSGSGRAVVACASGQLEVPMTVPAQGPAGFASGPASAEVEALIKNNGEVTDDQHWTKAVTLAFP